MSTITTTARKAYDTDLAERIARWVGLVLGLAVIISLLMAAGTAITVDLPVIGGVFNACSNGTAALNGASVKLADGWAACGASTGPDADFGQVFPPD